MAELKAVLFDVDGVLIDSAAVASRLLRASAAEHGAHLSAEELAVLSGASGLQFWRYVKDTYSLPDAVEDYRESYDVEAEVAAYDASLIAPGVGALMSALHSAGVLLGLVTSASCWRTDRVIDLLGVGDLLTVRICSDSVGRHKPDPAPYLAATEALGLPAVACLAVEDSARGVRSASAAGMTVLSFVGFSKDVEAVAASHGTVEDFRRESPTSLATAHAAATASFSS